MVECMKSGGRKSRMDRNWEKLEKKKRERG
jgi:hypothetical protein